MALKLAGEWGANVPDHVAAVVSVSAPLDYTHVSPWMDRLARLPYRMHVLGSLLRSARAFALQHPSRAHFRTDRLKRIKTFRAFDGEIIAPMHGFSDVDTYYEQASSGPWLSKITTPTLLVHADDDPMVPKHTVTPWLGRLGKCIQIEATKHGGHIGFFAGCDEDSWITNASTRRALAFIAEHTAP
jgi:predicted alpha/beta-fold hydrolase